MTTVAPSHTAPRSTVDRRRSHPDTPDTTELFQETATLPAGPRREALRAELVRAWLPMAYRIARRYRDRGEEREDLEQVAALGLTKAVHRYDPARGHAFASYAVPVITGEIKKHFRDHTWDVHVPRRVQELRNQIRKALRETSTDHTRHPQVEVLARALDLTPQEVRLGLDALHSHSALSLDAPASVGQDEGRERHTLQESLGSEDTRYEHVLLREAVRPKLRQLPERERYILYLRFYREMSQSEIGVRLGISQMHVSRILRRVCAQLREETDDSRPPTAQETPRDTARAETGHDRRRRASPLSPASDALSPASVAASDQEVGAAIRIRAHLPSAEGVGLPLRRLFRPGSRSCSSWRAGARRHSQSPGRLRTASPYRPHRVTD